MQSLKCQQNQRRNMAHRQRHNLHPRCQFLLENQIEFLEAFPRNVLNLSAEIDL